MSFKSDYAAFLFWKVGVIFFFLLSGNVYVEPSQSCLFVNQPDSVQRLICREQCQYIWEAAGNCPGFMVGADLCTGRAFTDLEKFWGVQVRWGPLCSHWGALPTQCCFLMVAGEAGCLPAHGSLQRESDVPHGRTRKVQICCRVCTVQTQLTEETLRPPWGPALSWMQWRWKETRDGDLDYQYLARHTCTK